MPVAHNSRVIDANVYAVWARLVDVSSWPRWLRVPYADQSVTVEPPAPVALDSTVVLKGRLPYRLFARVAELVLERRLALEIERSEYPSDRLFFQRALVTIDLEALNDSNTRVTATHEAEGKGVLGRFYMATVFRLFMLSNVRSIVNSLEQAQRGAAATDSA